MFNPVDRFYQFEPFRLYPAKRLLTRDNLPVTLAPKAFDTLLALVEGQAQVLDKEDLMRKVWPNSVVEENNLAQHIAALRKTLGESKDGRPYIVTVPGRGYQFVVPVQELWDDAGLVMENRRVQIEEEANGNTKAGCELRMLDTKETPPHAPKALRPRVLSRKNAISAFAIIAVLTAAALGYFAGKRAAPIAQSMPVHTVRRLTDFPGIEEFPSISPDRKYVAFTASVNGQRQIFVRLLAGGTPLLITKDPVDHQLPRWSPDTNTLVYFTHAGPDEAQGAIWSIPALGGSTRRVMASIGGADVSINGRLACFRIEEGKVQLVTSALDGTDVQVIARSVVGYHWYPRWSPDGQWIAFQRGDGVRYDIFIVSHLGGEPRQLTRDRNIISGLAWLPDSGGIIYSSSRGSTVPYLPTLALWEVRLDGQAPRQLTPAEVTYVQPDAHSTGLVSAARLRMRFDIWRFPFGSVPAENVRRGVQVTRQTGQVLTPTAAPDGNDVAFLSDSGGHGNLWVLSTRSGEFRQITFEDNPTVAVGVPLWSPNGRSIAFVSSKGRTGFDFGVWLVNPDGSNLRNLARQGLGMAWSSDGQWLYYADTSAGALYKVSPSGGEPVRVRSEPTRNVIGLHGATLYYMVERPLIDGRPEFEIRAATPEDGPSRPIARIPASRVPGWQIVNPSLSPDGHWFALPLTDGFTTNIWALSTERNEWRQVTDFGDRAIFIARRVSWSSDGRSILAAVGEGDADIVLLDGLLKRR